jgi:dTDP-4-dehydrorhamnose 3,5-epimerase
MKITPTVIPDVILIEPAVHGDQRGFFMESYHQNNFAAQGLDQVFVQDNHSRSEKGVLRGLHYQLKNPQGKLVRVVTGEVFDVAVDVRKGSPTFGKWVGDYLSETNHKMLYVPPGFAHGFCVVSESADFLYKCTEFYDPNDEQGIIWNDPQINISWPCETFQLSGKDQHYKTLAEMTDYLPDFRSSK